MSVDLIVSHSTPSMCFGYISSKMAKPVVSTSFHMCYLIDIFCYIMLKFILIYLSQ